MRGLLERGWVEIEPYDAATFWCGRPQYTIKDDPEAGTFDEQDFEEIDPTQS